MHLDHLDAYSGVGFLKNLNWKSEKISQKKNCFLEERFIKKIIFIKFKCLN